MTKDANEIWTEMEHSHAAFLGDLSTFLACTKQKRLEALRANYPRNRPLVILLLQHFVQTSDLEDLLPFLLSHVGSVHQYLFAFRAIIHRIPSDWLSEHIEEAAEPFLRGGNDETFRRFLELYIDIDLLLARRLAQRALESSDTDTREAGSDFLQKLDGPPRLR